MSEENVKVLFICTGNTCRSPMAEGLFKQLIEHEDGVECIGSAGVSAYPGDRMSRDTAVVLKSKEVSQAGLDSFRSRQVDHELMQEATHLFAMTAAHYNLLVEAFPEHVEKCHLVCDFTSFDGQVGVDVPDPIGQGPRAYQMVCSVFEQALPNVLKFVSGK